MDLGKLKPGDKVKLRRPEGSYIDYGGIDRAAWKVVESTIATVKSTHDTYILIKESATIQLGPDTHMNICWFGWPASSVWPAETHPADLF